ncbi:hypothetical protein OIDMADRAFT_167131 [Oidiodendron maius Zn]|uniref:HTH CENPB-type domain-containing protein n=1 Tax=Oidiodendron maius (strain Zn) TaxID=913774 RepID=A0A0C3CH48_OIDMZ|nr:hypothetical protein OIDMADRAFT_167131 [Oidiodendron maius Zn]
MSSSRAAIPHSQRLALRHYYQTTNPKPTHSALKIWFKTHFGHEISQSIVSRSLSDSFACLDVCVPSRPIVSKFRVRNGQWPWMDTLLSDWLQSVETQSSKVSNDVIRRKARQIWNDSDESQGLVMPKFSAGWIAKFRRRHMIRHRPLLDRHHFVETPDHLLDKEYSSQSHRGSTQTLEQGSIIVLPQSKTATRNVPTNSTSPDSELNTTTTPTLSSDHLIHLIQYTVFRALIYNKSLLRTVANFLKAPYPVASSNESATQLCGGLTVIRPLIDQNIPDSLYPTLLQMNCVHTGWIDMFPFPKFRDNLIKRGVDFVPEEMRQEICGDIFPDYVTPILGDDDHALLSTPPSTPTNSGANNKEFGDPDDYTAGRRGLIAWGEPWKIESWEVTPGFLRNWGWALEGCDDLIQASNRWRAQRNEELLLPM